MQELLAVDDECSSSKNFAKRCRASCHEKYPLMEFCKPSLEAKFAELEERLNNLALTSAGAAGGGGAGTEGGSPVVLTTTGTEEFPRTAGGDVDFKVNTPCKVGEMRSYPMKEQKSGTIDELTTVYYLYVCVQENLWSSIHSSQRFRMANSEEVCEGHGYNKEQCPTNTGCCCYGEICENAGISTADELCRSAAYGDRPSTWPCENYRGE